jgi:hypothetical protein
MIEGNTDIKDPAVSRVGIMSKEGINSIEICAVRI